MFWLFVYSPQNFVSSKFLCWNLNVQCDRSWSLRAVFRSWGKRLMNEIFAVVQSLSCVWLFAAPWTAARQASLSFTISWSLLKLMSIQSVMPSNHLIFCHPLLLLPSIFPSFRVFSDSALCISWPKYWSLIFSISPFNEYLVLLKRDPIEIPYPIHYVRTPWEAATQNCSPEYNHAGALILEFPASWNVRNLCCL